MNITVESTSDSPEAVTAAQGGLAKEELKVETNKSAAESAEAPTAETASESDTLEDEGSDEDVEGNAEPEEGEAKTDEEKKAKKKNGFKKRIDKLNKRLSERDRELEALRQAVSQNQAPKDTQPKSTASSQDLEAKPTAAQFDSHDEYVEALADWKVEQKLKARDVQAKETQAKTEYQSQVQKHFERVDSFKKAHDDFEDVMEDVGDVFVPAVLQEAIVSSENGPALMYELGKDRAEFERITKLPAIAAAREIGRLEARIAASAEPKKEIKEAKKTKAPPPINPVGSKATAVTKSLEDMDVDEFIRERNEQLRRRRA